MAAISLVMKCRRVIVVAERLRLASRNETHVREGVGVAAVLAMKLEAMVSTAQFLANQADELQSELDSITGEWRELSSTWTGAAASAFDPPWDEWHYAAVTVTAILQEHSDLLMRTVALMAEHESTAAHALGAVPPKGTQQ
jgi:WXG100 family type VII secretion target